MEYYSAKEVAKQLAVTKRYITQLCATNIIKGAMKKDNKWLIPKSFVENKKTYKRQFNTTGVCYQDEHYMVDLTQRLESVKVLVDEGKYFTINRARQFGKTTTLNALSKFLSKDYFVVYMDFQTQMSASKFKDENSFSIAFARGFESSFRIEAQEDIYQQILKDFSEERKELGNQFELVELFQALRNLCAAMPKKIVLMIDEVDKATNNQVFLDFIAQLRGCYINRKRFPTFQTVILSSVYDIRHLNCNGLPEDHIHNIPWNIAADFDVDMSFSSHQISAMLLDYFDDYDIVANANDIANEIYDYTAGYPYLVSRLCQLMDNMYQSGKDDSWSHSGLLEAVNKLLRETNSLFDDMTKKIADYPQFASILKDILFRGQSIPFNMGTQLVSIGTMFGFLKDLDGQLAISNRIFEIWFYNLFIAQDAINNQTYNAGAQLKNQISTLHELDIELILKKFIQHFHETFGECTDAFVEEKGRELFLLYIRPFINGVGNYYIESRTRSHKRTDLIIDYYGKQYIIEMKIWHGNEYNQRGEQQLIGYLDEYNLKRGYMLSFNFNKNKVSGIKEIHLKNHTLVEAVV